MTAEHFGSSKRLRDLQKRLGYSFRSVQLLEQSLTHSSFHAEPGGRRHCNERLEFLGDRVLGLVIADVLIHRFVGEEVGALARRHAALVRREALVEVAESLALPACIRMAHGEEDAGGRRNPGLVSDACEAVIAAVYLDGGFGAARTVVETLWQGLVERDASPPKDPKTLLQEWAQGLGLALPQYREVDRSGPPHAPIFQVEVRVETLQPVIGSGTSKRFAERAAAAAMLGTVEQRGDSPGDAAAIAMAAARMPGMSTAAVPSPVRRLPTVRMKPPKSGTQRADPCTSQMASDPSPLDPQSAPSPAGRTRCGFVAVLGAPNVGKSTLVNRLVGSKVSIVSPKVQTTRARVVGVALFGVSQVLLVDTPGLFEPRRRLDRAMVAAAWEGAAGADAVMLMIDAVRGSGDSGERVGRWLRGQRLPGIAVLNKVDRAEKPQLLAYAAALQATQAFVRIFMVSALTGDGIADLADYLAELVPTGPWLYPEDQVSDMPSRILAAEITREKLFWLLRQELPYAVAVETESWTEQRDGSLRLEQIVWVEREGQRAIILGRGGQQIKRIGAQAREEMSRIFERRVHLFLYVKVRAGWTDDPRFYHLHGLTVPPAR